MHLLIWKESWFFSNGKIILLETSSLMKNEHRDLFIFFKKRQRD